MVSKNKDKENGNVKYIKKVYTLVRAKDLAF